MKRFWRIGFISAFVSIVCLAKTPITLQYHFESDMIQYTTTEQGCELRMVGSHYQLKPGYPELPVYNKSILLGQNMTATGIKVVSQHWETLSTSVALRPQPYPQIISLPIQHNPIHKAPVYNSKNAYPECSVKFCGCYSRDNLETAVLEIIPIRYFPAQNKLEILKEIEIELITEAIEPSIETMEGPGDYKYLIIGPESYEVAFEDFINWKTQKGVKTQYLHLEWICTNQTGNDKQEKIRAAIINEKNNHNINYVLLVGDDETLPIRYCRNDLALVSDKLGADLYYADLDGNYNADGNAIYGEVSDDVDLYPDVYIGRAWADDLQDAETFVSKVLQYEQTPSENYVETTAFLAEILWTVPFSDSSIHKDMIETLCFPNDWPDITKLYATAGTETYETVMNTLNSGGHFLNHDGHSGPTAWGIGEGHLSTGTISSLQNVDKLWLIHSIGCLSNRFSSTCVGTTFMTNPNGGAVAYMGNFGYGWGMPGSPGFGVSDMFDTKFWELLFSESDPHLGKVFADSKAYFVPQSQETNVFRWVEYSLNLMGDPEMPVWTKNPQVPSINHPQNLSPTADNALFWVFLDSQSLADATVCLYRDGECFEVMKTNHNGMATLDLPTGLSGPLTLTVTAPNCLPYQTTIPIDGLPDLQVESIQFDDGTTAGAQGDNDNHCEPGETINLSPRCVNNGVDPATSIHGTLSIENPYITVVNNESDYPDLNGSASGLPEFPFTLEIAPDCPPNTNIQCDLLLEFNSVTWTTHFSLPIDQECIQLERYFIYDMIPGGNGNGFLEPNETAYIGLKIKNTGRSNAENPELRISSDDPEISILTNRVEFPTLDFDESAMGYDRFWISYTPDRNDSDLFLNLTAEWKTNQCRNKPISLAIPIGDPGFFDDVESQEVPWQFEPAEAGWCIDSYRSYSGSSSWYCGNPIQRKYNLEMDCSLTSPPVFITTDAVVSFARWFDFPVFGEDGIKIEYLIDDQWQQIGFIGGGGALNLQSDWMVESFALPIENTITQIRFHFVASDSTIGEGIYLDDITVSCEKGGVWSSESKICSDPPACHTSGLKLVMPHTVYQTGNSCQLTAWLCNMSSQSNRADLYVILDVWGEIYFAPSWNSTSDFVEISLSPGQTSEVVLPEFLWPDIAGEANGLIFWAGLLDTESGELFGEYDYWEFGWM